MNTKGYRVTVPPGGPTYPTTPADWIAFPFVLVATAKRNSGKTCSMTAFLHILHRMDRLDRLIVVSPAFGNNAHYFEGLPVSDVIEPTVDSAQQVIDIVEDEAQEYEAYHERLLLWRQLKKLLRTQKEVDEFIDSEVVELFGPNLEKPQHKWGGRKPVVVAIFDDIQGTPCFTPRSKVNYMTIKHRHIGETRHGSIGVNLMFAVQSYVSTGGTGLPKTVRCQITHLMVFKTKSQKELDLIAEEAAGEVDKETFFKLYEEATSKPYSFMLIDFSKKKTHPSMFRQNFDRFLTP